MTRILASLFFLSAANPVLAANIIFDFPRLDFPAPTVPAPAGTLSTHGQ